MTAKNMKACNMVRYDSLDTLPPAPPFIKTVKSMSDANVEARAVADPDAGVIPEGFWDKAHVVEPEGTEQITLRLPRRVVGHFKATGKGYQSRISAVLASYVDATGSGGLGEGCNCANQKFSTRQTDAIVCPVLLQRPTTFLKSIYFCIVSAIVK